MSLRKRAALLRVVLGISSFAVGVVLAKGSPLLFGAPLSVFWVMLFSNFVRISAGMEKTRTHAEWKKIDESIFGFPTIVAYVAIVAALVGLSVVGKMYVAVTPLDRLMFEAFGVVMAFFTMLGCYFLLGSLVVFLTRETLDEYATKHDLTGRKKEILYLSALLCWFMAAFAVIAALLAYVGAALPYLSADAVCFIFSFLLFIANANNEGLNRPNTVRFLLAVFVTLTAIAALLDFLHAVPWIVTAVVLVEGAIAVLACYLVADAYALGVSKKA